MAELSTVYCCRDDMSKGSSIAVDIHSVRNNNGHSFQRLYAAVERLKVGCLRPE